MKLKYLTLAAFLLSSSANVFASDIFCPQTIHCVKQVCAGNPLPESSFQINVLPGNPLPDGIYYFSEAWGNANKYSQIYQCAYRNSNGNTVAAIKTNKGFKADYSGLFGNAWIDVGGKKEGSGYCGPNTTPPYLADAKRCPFIQ